MSYITDMVKRPPSKPSGPSKVAAHSEFTREEWAIIHEALCFIRKKLETQEAFIKFIKRNYRGDPSIIQTFEDGCSYEGHYLIGMIFNKIQEMDGEEE